MRLVVTFCSLVALLTIGTAHAASVTIKKSDDGQLIYSQEGCNGIENVILNLPAGYVVQPKITHQNAVLICGSLNLVGKDMRNILQQIAERMSDCFVTKIDPSDQTVVLTPLPGLKVITKKTQSTTTYELNGSAVFVQPESETQTIQMCVLDPSGLKDEFPYNQFVK